MYTVRALTLIDALEIAVWRYDPPYHIYNMTGVDSSDEEVARMVDTLLDPANGYFAVDDDEGLLAFCCFGKEGQVPGYDYSQLDALDVGVGMHPARLGQGRGRALMAAILAFGENRYRPIRWRTTVAAFNLRSQQMCRNAGFTQVDEFVSTGAPPRPFVVFDKEVTGER